MGNVGPTPRTDKQTRGLLDEPDDGPILDAQKMNPDQLRQAHLRRDPLAQLINDRIEKLPAATRLYPDLYAVTIADAIRSAVAAETAKSTDGSASLAWIRQHYGVPAEIDAPIRWTDGYGQIRCGVITGADTAHLWVSFDGELPILVHPEWNVEYVSGE